MTLATVGTNKAFRGVAFTPSNPPIVLTVPANISVPATGPADAVVTYTIATTGGVAPVTVVANPPSGSTFPLGTTTVTGFASDSAGQSANASFTVTVFLPVPNPRFFSSDVLPPTNGAYGSTGQFFQLYANGIVLRNVNLHSPEPSVGTGVGRRVTDGILAP